MRGNRAIDVALFFAGVGEAKRSGRWWRPGDKLRIAFRVEIEKL